MPGVVKFLETESRMMAARGWEDGEFMFNGYRVLVWEDEKFWEMDDGDD